jgi:hypothetical protein
MLSDTAGAEKRYPELSLSSVNLRNACKENKSNSPYLPPFQLSSQQQYLCSFNMWESFSKISTYYVSCECKKYERKFPNVRG